jgi:excinuclease ABC subunit C
MRDNAAAIIYIGKAKNLKKRVASYFLSSKLRDPKFEIFITSIRHVDYVVTASERDALVLERRLINRYKPAFNVMWKDDKSYPYLTLTLQEDFPRLFLTRIKKNDGALYFGPYPSVSRVRQLLKWSWRKKLFALRPCDLKIEEGKPWAYEKVKTCLYLHTGQCTAPCVGKITSKNYKKIADRARWFFSGQKEKMIRQLEREMKAQSKNLKYEEAAQSRDRIDTLRHMNEKVTFGEMTEAMLETRVQETRAVQDLMRALKLPRPPEHIECFDISHFQGVEKVASMVCFKNGRPVKSDYRKFIIKTVQGIDDFKSMAEVVYRRYRRLKNEDKKLPDLILVDGGKGQLSSALEALTQVELASIPLAALAKQEEEIFLPGETNSIRLSQDSPALLLLRYIRDEAHRFAITFHRLRRNKKTWIA